jgi:hypothetical protein
MLSVSLFLFILPFASHVLSFLTVPLISEGSHSIKTSVDAQQIWTFSLISAKISYLDVGFVLSTEETMEDYYPSCPFQTRHGDVRWLGDEIGIIDVSRHVLYRPGHVNQT